MRNVSVAPHYNAFNLLIASPEAAFVAYNRGGDVEVVQLQAGFHLLTNIDVDDFECPRISRAYSGFAHSRSPMPSPGIR